MIVRCRERSCSRSVLPGALDQGLWRDPGRPGAGLSAATIVVNTPTAIAIATVEASSARPEVGSSKPIALNRPSISSTKPKPPAIPSSDAESRPTSAASIRTAAITRRLEAPSVRSIANSRILWATVIEKVLKIRNAPTKTAIPAKTSSAGKAEALLDVAGVLLRRLLAGAHLDLVGGQRGGDRRRQLGGGGSSRRWHSGPVDPPRLPVSRCASASVNSTRLAPPSGVPIRTRRFRPPCSRAPWRRR